MFGAHLVILAQLQLVWLQIKASKEEEDAGAKGRKAVEAARRGSDRGDPAAEALAQRVGDRVLEVVEQPAQVGLDRALVRVAHPGHPRPEHRLQLHGVEVPPLALHKKPAIGSCAPASHHSVPARTRSVTCHPLASKVEAHVGYLPRLVAPQRLADKRLVSHAVIAA